MARSKSSEVRRFVLIAVQRLEDSDILLEHDRTTAAMYLAGYGVECGLKALVMAYTPTSRHSAVLRSFRGRMGHDLEWLKREVRRCKVNIPVEAADQIMRVRSWSTDLRYTAGRKSVREARAFLTAAAAVLYWVRGRI